MTITLIKILFYLCFIAIQVLFRSIAYYEKAVIFILGFLHYIIFLH